MESTPGQRLIERFTQAFVRLTPETVLPIDELYATDVVFEDPMHRIVGNEALAKYFAKLNSRLESAEFVFEARVIGATEAALSWTMIVNIRRPRQTIVVPGASIIRFTDRITYQRDYFDVGAMLYERLPLFGWFLRRLKKLAG